MVDAKTSKHQVTRTYLHHCRLQAPGRPAASLRRLQQRLQRGLSQHQACQGNSKQQKHGGQMLRLLRSLTELQEVMC